MDTILVLGSLSDTDETTRFLVGLAEKSNVRVVKMDREEYDSVTAASEDGVRRDLEKEGIDLTDGDWNQDATDRLEVRLRAYLHSERDVDPDSVRATIVIPADAHATDWWPFSELTSSHALIASRHA